jgi:hypothetical protein
MGPTVQLDDFPYVHLMRRIDEELTALRAQRLYFQAPDRPFRDARDWATLIHLVNDDYADLVARAVHRPASAAEDLFERFDRASIFAGIGPRLASLDVGTRRVLATKLEAEATAQLADKHAGYPPTLSGRSLVIEFARGGPQGATLPLAAPIGYHHSLARLAAPILEKASILYVWVTPEESRRKNLARTDPNDPGSILHHGVPIDVMMNDYGCDDMDWLEDNSERRGTVTVEAHGRRYHLPIARFDNRVDRTSFLRNPQSDWRPEQVRGIHDGLKSALDRLARQPH